jgi:hypothetical protein
LELSWQETVIWGDRDQTRGPLDEVFAALRGAFPDLRIKRVTVTHPADDDNVWFIARSGHDLDLQIDSAPDGAPPFLLESHNDRTSTDDVREAIGWLTRWLAEATDAAMSDIPEDEWVSQPSIEDFGPAERREPTGKPRST